MLGVSSLVDSLNHAKPPGATEACVLGPFYTEDAHVFQNGDSIASEDKGDYMYVYGKVTDTSGKPIPGAIIDTWETDGHGLYDTQVSIHLKLERIKPWLFPPFYTNTNNARPLFLICDKTSFHN